MDGTYATRLQVIGALIDQAQLRDVCVTESSDGVVVVGLAQEGRNVAGMVLIPQTLTIPNSQITRLLATREPKRGPRLFGR